MAFLALKNVKFLPVAQPWWAAGCAVRGVGGPRGKMLLTQFASAQGSEPLELKSYFGQLDTPEEGVVSIHALRR